MLYKNNNLVTLFFRQELHLCVDLNLTVESTGVEEEDELYSL